MIELLAALLLLQDKDLHAFATKHGPVIAAVLAVSSTGLTWVRAGEWSRATKEQRVDLATKVAAAHRPAAGVLACVDKEAKFLVMIGAGKPGAAKGAGAFIVEPK